MKDDYNQSQNSLQQLHMICHDIDQWPQSWAGDAQDIIVGSLLLREFKNYLVQLIDKGRATATIRKHADYIWALGGEIIRDTNEHGIDQKLPAKNIILQYIGLHGGPYWRHANNDNDLQQYDSVCRLLYKYLSQHDVH
jgi:hypothetical protein